MVGYSGPPVRCLFWGLQLGPAAHDPQAETTPAAMLGGDARIIPRTPRAAGRLNPGAAEGPIASFIRNGRVVGVRRDEVRALSNRLNAGVSA